MENLPIRCSRSKPAGRSLDGTVDLQGHRGARGKRPENTIPAFEYCIEHQMTSIELDTNVTKDKQLIVNHDTTVNGNICLSKNGKSSEFIPIKDLTVGELKRLDCGSVRNVDFPEQIPVGGTRLITLTEFFDFVKAYERDHGVSRTILFNIETKFRDDHSFEDIQETARLMVETIEAAGMAARSTVQSFVTEVLPEVKKLNHRIKTSALFEPTVFQRILLNLGFGANRNEIIQHAAAIAADIISPHYIYVNEIFVHHCHQKFIKVLPWVVNETETIKRLLNYGVDGIISDYPDRLSRVYSKWSECRMNAPGDHPGRC
ncbi:glycerophosphodiester phosphodiesterase family protein [Thermodesulfobacteriota bacterium]